MNKVLHVWRDQLCIGELSLGPDERSMAFTYTAPLPPMAISNSLPLHETSSANGHNWFANLLPEEGSRQQLVRRLGVVDEDFALLAAIGGDCAGALQLLPPGSEVEQFEGASEVDRIQLARWAEGKERYALFEPGQLALTRLSLAGAQDKVPVLIRDGHILLPQGRSASSHLLKFAAKPALILNELYLNRLASALGIPVPESHIGRAGKGAYLAVARYDRETDPAGSSLRLHQEDLCQALGLPRRLKYQEEGGPTLGACAALLRRISRTPALEVRQLLRWQLFNVLAGNSDGHAKNLSLLQDTQGRWRLAPAYDLVCTRVLPYSPNLGFAVGDNFHPQELRRRDWEALARDMQLAPPFVLRELREMGAALEPLAAGETLRQDMLQVGMHETEWSKLQHVRKYITQQCRRYRSMT